MGEDTYDNFKLVIKKILEKQKRHDTQLRIHVKRDDEKMIIIPLPADNDNLEDALDTLPEFLDANPDLDGWIIFDQGKWKKSR